MPKYICVRCGHGASQLGDLRKHLNKAKECTGYFDKNDRQILLEMLANPKDYISYLNTNYPQFLENAVNPIENNASKNGISSSKNLVFPSKNNSSSSKNIKPVDSDTFRKCSKCNKCFNSRQALWYHEKHCKEIIVNADSTGSGNINMVGNNNNNTVNNNTVNNTINNNNNTINNNINAPKLCIFGQEDISHIVTLDQINDYERLARRDPTKVIPTVVKDIYFNKDHPENHTVKIETIHGNLALVRIGLPDEWEYVDRKATISNMIKTGINATETGKMDTDNIPRFDNVVNCFYGENNPHYNNAIKSVDTLLIIDLHQQKQKLLYK